MVSLVEVYNRKKEGNSKKFIFKFENPRSKSKFKINLMCSMHVSHWPRLSLNVAELPCVFGLELGLNCCHLLLVSLALLGQN